jgi:hypothetical protein
VLEAIDELVGEDAEFLAPRIALGVDVTTLELPVELLAGGLQVIDTPGIDSTSA